jgi:ABC-type multidrug transport system fused ATPase/permease subunit
LIDDEATWLRAQAAQAIAIAQVSQATANLEADQTALGKATIVSPIDGIVLNRFVEPGQTVALVGHTGSGKSSMVNLIAKFYLPNAGDVVRAVLALV